jgi:tetratricopeptide (TPR) repeat protein
VRRDARNPLVPSFEEAVQALLSHEPARAVALFAARRLADPTDDPSRKNHAVALFRAGRWAEAGGAFAKLILEEGGEHANSVASFFSLGVCRLELDDAPGALLATTAFLDFANARHPFYLDGVQNTANAWDRLGAHTEAASLYRSVLGVEPRPHAFNGLALALEAQGLAREALWVIELARRCGCWDEELDSNADRVREEADGPPAPTRLVERPWSRRRIIETSFRMLGLDGKARPARRCSWPIDG